MLKLQGTLLFAPDRSQDRGGNALEFKKKDKVNTLILDLPHLNSLAHYCISLVQSAYGPWYELAPPLFGTHVTIVRGNADKFIPTVLYQFHQTSMTVEADVSTLHPAKLPIKDAATFWRIDITSDEPFKLREQAAVKALFEFRPHLTIGRTQPHSRQLRPFTWNPLRIAKRAAKAATGSGNNYLLKDLKAFVKGFGMPTLATHGDLITMIRRHIIVPSRPWEERILGMICYPEGTFHHDQPTRRD